MTIFGIGNDLIETGRIEEAISSYGSRFLDRHFTKREQEYCDGHKNRAVHYAGRFAAKEACVKALGSGIRDGLGWLDIEIVNNGMGKPEVVLSARVEERFRGMRVFVSISHTKGYAMGVAVVEGGY